MRRLLTKPWFPFALLARLLALLLLAAAGLKLYGLGVDPAGRNGFFAAPEWQAGVVEMEIFLALWLFAGSQAIGAWLSVLAVFSCFAAASFYQGWIGQASCGCFGAVQVNPWLTFGLDIGVLSMLVIGRPDLQPLRQKPRSVLAAALLPLAGGIVGIVAILGVLAGIAHAGFGSTRGALAFLRGERIAVSPRLLDMGEGVAGESREGSVHLLNLTAQPVRLYGGTSDCSCVATEDLPLTIPPGEERSVRVKMRLPAANGAFNRTAFLMTDDEQARTIMFRLTGTIKQSAELAKSDD